MILIGRDCNEGGLREDECPPAVDGPIRLVQNQMEAGLVAVHGIDDCLPKEGDSRRDHTFALHLC